MKFLSEVNIRLVAVSSTAPSTCVIGNKYYNSTDNVIYRAIDTNTWSPTGTTPVFGIFYPLIDNSDIYQYDGTKLVSIFLNTSGYISEAINLHLGAKEEVLSEAIANLFGSVEALIKRSFKDETLNSLNLLNPPLLGGDKFIILGTQAPTISPDFVGQVFINKTDKAGYIACGTSTAADWKLSTVQTLSDSLINIAALGASTTSTGLLKKTGKDTWILDTSSYITSISKAMVENVLIGNITSHTHTETDPVFKAALKTTLTATSDDDVPSSKAVATYVSSYYQPKSSTLASLNTMGADTTSVGLLQKTGKDTWVFNIDTYLTSITQTMVENVLTGTITSHSHTETDPVFTAAFNKSTLSSTNDSEVPSSKAIASYLSSGYQPIAAILTSLINLGGGGTVGLITKSAENTVSIFSPSTTLTPTLSTEIPSSLAIATYISSLDFQQASLTLEVISYLGVEEGAVGVLVKQGNDEWILDSSILDSSFIKSRYEKTVNNQTSTRESGVYTSAEEGSSLIEVYANQVDFYPDKTTGTIYPSTTTTLNIYGDLWVKGGITSPYFTYSPGYVLGVEQGGTGANNPESVRINLGLGNVANLNYIYDSDEKKLIIFEPAKQTESGS